ncbi:MAG: NAD(P)/FAD-dependent oxidoreductase [Coriobacteriales bacterium]|jgi:thioredoxin reductase (NADPH)|nr:NAD(P)/FAD-dependent oxidoreductase [Coriobacteriales bacterium]
MTTYDIAIIGAGPAGLSAGITARARNKETIIISNKFENSPLAKSKIVDNYPGMPHTSGFEMLDTMTAQARNLGCAFMNARVITVLPIKNADTTTFSITTGSEVVEAKALIMATGSSTGAKAIDGETEYLGRGVSYCATCDGMLFRNAIVCLIGLSSDAEEEALFLAELGATVHYIVPEESAAAASEASATESAAESNAKGNAESADKINQPNITTYTATVLAIEGDALGVTGVRIKEADTEGDLETTIPCQGVFILRPSVAPSSLLSALEIKDDFIQTDAAKKTNLAGVFAAGDCTGKPHQIAKAVGEGQLACFSAVEYLDAL